MKQTEINILNCEYQQGVLHKFYFRQAQNIYKFLVRKSGNYYLKPNDIISHRPTLFNYHEPHLETLFFQLSKTHDDFLIDIGANIGMTSVMVGHAFKSIHCVEPNTIISKILDVNLSLAEMANKTTIHEIGLGHETKIEELHIPKLNFGGAYIASNNDYNNSDAVMQRHDEEKTILNIQIVEANDWIKTLFSANKDWKNGVIKIDVEGFESHVFKALLNSIPKDVSVVVIMENFLDKFEFETFKSPNHTIEWFGFYKQKQYLKSFLFKLFGMSSYYKQGISKIDKSKNAPHDLIAIFSAK